MSLIQQIQFDAFGDERGQLVPLEAHKNIPFDIKRVYYIFGTKPGIRRGFHAHRNLKQMLICTSGGCRILLDDGKNQQQVHLNQLNMGLYIDGMVWREMYDFSEDCVLMVLASDLYDEADYIRDYEQFVKEVNDVNCTSPSR